jgi:hypothetical protein
MMKGSKPYLGRMVCCLLLAATVCFGSDAALAACTVSSSEAVPCYIVVQPIDVCNNNTGVCAPFNTTSSTGNYLTAGMPSQTPIPALPSPIPASIPNNPASSNPIGFTVCPATGVSPPDASCTTGGAFAGVDISRELLNNIGVDLVWLPMVQYKDTTSTSFTSLTITPTTNTAASCSGYISGFTLTIKSCSSGTVAVSNGLSGTGVAAGNVVTGVISTGSGGAGTYTVLNSQTVGTSSKPIAINATTTSLGSMPFQTLTQQPAISQGTTPTFPRNPNNSVINLFFVDTLTPAAGGTLYGFSWFCKNGIVIGKNTFFPPSGLDPRPDTIVHEMLHNLCLDHTSYGAGPWVPPTNVTMNSYTAPFGVVPPIPTNPLPTFGQCNTSTVVGDTGIYPACGANLMTSGDLRTEPKVSCVLAPSVLAGGTMISACMPPANGLTAQSPGLYTGEADQLAVQVTTPSAGSALLPAFASHFGPTATPATGVQLPVPQETKVLDPNNGLLCCLFTNTNPATGLPLNFAGLVSPIPQETTKAEVGTDGRSTNRAVFDLSGPDGGKPGQTLVGWILTLPQKQTFARHDGFQILSQSRADLVQDVNYYPAPENHPLMRRIAYQPGSDNNSESPSIGSVGPSPCAPTSESAECLVVKFQSPGLGAGETISFAENIRSGDAPITNDELCEAKITYIFSDGFMTTSNFGRCPAVSLPLIASSWHPDPHVAPQMIETSKTNLLLAQATSGPSGDQIQGSAWVNTPQALSATIDAPNALGAPDVTFTVPASACFGMVPPLTLCFDDQPNTGNGTLGEFLTRGGARNITEITSGALAQPVTGTSYGVGTLFQFTGMGSVATNDTFQASDDDGASLAINGVTIFSFPGPTSDRSQSGTYTGPPGTWPFTLVYGECCGLPATLEILLPSPLLIVDADASLEGGQTNSVCSNGLAPGGPIHGTIPGNVTIPPKKNCTYQGPNCELLGNLTINGGSATIDNCHVDGNITVIAGSLFLRNSAVAGGNINISGAGSFNIGQSQINGSLNISGVAPNPPGIGTYTVCSNSVSGSISVQNNNAAIQIGTGGPCHNGGNTISGQLLCTGNSTTSPNVLTGGGNRVSGHQSSGQCQAFRS